MSEANTIATETPMPAKAEIRVLTYWVVQVYFQTSSSYHDYRVFLDRENAIEYAISLLRVNGACCYPPRLVERTDRAVNLVRTEVRP